MAIQKILKIKSAETRPRITVQKNNKTCGLAVSDYTIEINTIPKCKTTVKHLTIRCFAWLVDWLTFLPRKFFHDEKLEILGILLHKTRSDWLIDWLDRSALAEFKLLVRDQRYGWRLRMPVRLRGVNNSDPLQATYNLPTWINPGKQTAFMKFCWVIFKNNERISIFAMKKFSR